MNKTIGKRLWQINAKWWNENHYSEFKRNAGGYDIVWDKKQEHSEPIIVIREKDIRGLLGVLSQIAELADGAIASDAKSRIAQLMEILPEDYHEND